jgi:hypothetical protein
MGSVVGGRSGRYYERLKRPGGSLAAEENPIESLNKCIQDRFHDLDNFGMARLPVVPQHVQRFQAETPQEKEAVARFQEDGWQVAFYLGGRKVMESGMSKEEWKQAGEDSLRRAISEPIFITDQKAATDLPRPWELWEHSQKALAASITTDSYTSTVGRWFLDARPVRADRKACLDCHCARGANPWDKSKENALRVGDALGVVIYLYAKKP